MKVYVYVHTIASVSTCVRVRAFVSTYVRACACVPVCMYVNACRNIPMRSDIQA